MSRRMLQMLVGCLLVVTVYAASEEEPRELNWEELIPDGDLPALQSVPPGSGGGLEYPAPQYPVGAVDELDGQRVRLPGFIVPLESDEGGLLSEFFLVPYFGACIHVPPPPPNQIVYVTLEEPFNLESMWDPYWITGTLRTKGFSHGLGASLYTMEAEQLKKYEY